MYYIDNDNNNYNNDEQMMSYLEMYGVVRAESWYDLKLEST